MKKLWIFSLVFIFYFIIVVHSEEVVRVYIYHTNDIHGRMFDDSSNGSGSFARVAYYLKKQKSNFKNVIIIDAGDYFQGTPEGIFSKGQALIDIFNACHYDVLVPGNHDIDLGEDVLFDNLKKFKGSVLCCNFNDTLWRSVIKPYKVLDVDGVKIGFIGYSNVFELDQNSIRKAIYEVQEQGANYVVLITHVGIDIDRKIASLFPDIDLIIGAHSHTKLEYPFIDPKSGTRIVQTGAYLRNLGEIELVFNKLTKKLEFFSYNLIPVSSIDEKDKEVEKIMLSYKNKISKIVDTPLCKSYFPISKWAPDGYGNSPLGNLICDVMREKYKVDFAFVNKTGIRASISGGNITLRKIIYAYPFNNRVCVFKLKGKQIREIFRNSITKFEFSGLKAKLTEGKVLIKINNEFLKDDKEYTVASVDYYVNFLKQHFPMKVEYKDKVHNILVEYFKKFKVFKYRWKPRVWLR